MSLGYRPAVGILLASHCYRPTTCPSRAVDPDISAAARQVNSDLLEQVLQQQQQRGLSSSASSLDSQALLATVR